LPAKAESGYLTHTRRLPAGRLTADNASILDFGFRILDCNSGSIEDDERS
jgi:hypothetical protein